MATAADIIRDALKALAVLAAGETLGADDQADGIRALNLLLGSWANERILVHGTRRATYTLTPSLSPHTIGSGGTLNTTRPLRIDGAGVIPVGSTNETPLKILTDAEYQAIPDKALTEVSPQRLWVEWTHPTAKLWFWPVPTTAATLALYTWSRIAEFAASDTVTLPDGYEDALIHALALRLAPSYGVQPSTQLVQNAMDAKAAIMRTNSPDVVSELDSALTTGPRGSDVTIAGGGTFGGGLF